MTEPPTQKIRLSFYPYTYVRTMVMRTMLLRAETYHKLLKMDFNEIARFLEETTYKQSIDALAGSITGAELIEAALNDNLAKTFAKLRRSSPPELGILINEYLKRKDIEDIKTIIRAVLVKADENIIEQNISGAGTLSRRELLALFRLANIEHILRGITFIPFERLKSAYEAYTRNNSLAALENALDRFYYRSLLSLSGRLPKEGEIFKDFLLKEIQILNLLTIIRLKHAQADTKTIMNHLIFTDDEAYQQTLEKWIDSDFPTLIKLTQRFAYKDIIARGLADYEKSGSLVPLEAGLSTYLYRTSLHHLHKHPLSIDVILGFLFAKDVEVKNLRAIVKGKKLGVSEQFIEEHLVY